MRDSGEITKNEIINMYIEQDKREVSFSVKLDAARAKVKKVYDEEKGED